MVELPAVGAARKPSRDCSGWRLTAGFIAFLFIVWAPRAWAIPAFARKYGTSCQTCHTIYPKLNPFGEAFRRDGFRFPGIDGDYVQQQTIPLGQDQARKEFPKSTWPGSLPGSPPLAFGVNGAATIHPDTSSGAGKADNGTAINLHDLVDEAHIWAGGSFSERITFFGELTFSSDGVEIEHAIVLFNDIFKLTHAINLVVGKTMPTLTSFGGHSSYVADAQLPTLSVTSLFGGTSDAWVLPGSYSGLEVNGVIRGRFTYALGYNAGQNIEVRNAQNAYGHAGFKIGGMRMDGEPSSWKANPLRPWEETALTVDAFFYRSASRFTTPGVVGPPPLMDVTLDDSVLAFGGGLRGQWHSLELDAGVYQERHDHVLGDGTGVNALTQYNELSYIVFPWLVPALRVEYVRLDVGNGGPGLYEWRFIPGIAALVVQNLKLTLVAQIEYAKGAPDAGWGPANGFAAPASPTQTVGEIESLALGMAYAF